MADGLVLLRKEFDQAGRLVSEERPASGVVGFTYDEANLLESVSYPGGGQATSTRDAAGRLTASTDPSGRGTTMTYATGTGRLATVSDGALTVTYGYSALGTVSSLGLGGGATTSFENDVDGNVVELQEIVDPAIEFALERTDLVGGAW